MTLADVKRLPEVAEARQKLATIYRRARQALPDKGHRFHAHVRPMTVEALRLHKAQNEVA